MPLRVAAPGAEAAAVLASLVDTGADCTLVPAAAARALQLPAIDEIWLEGVAGPPRRATVHAALVEFAGIRRLARVVAFGTHAILGRDLLNAVVARLDGPALTLSVQRQRSPPRRRSPGGERLE